MKSLLKIGSLFALIIAGRYMQLTTPGITSGIAKAPIMLLTPNNTLTLTRYNQSSNHSSIIPVSQRKQQLPVTWF